MEHSQLPHCRPSAARPNMSRQVRLTCVTFIVLYTSGSSTSPPLLAVGSTMTYLAGAVMSPLLLEQAAHKWLLAQALSPSAQQKTLGANVAKRSKRSSNNSRRNTSCCSSSSNTRFHDLVADSRYGNSPVVAKSRRGTSDEGSPSFAFLGSLAASPLSRLCCRWESLRRPIAQPLPLVWPQNYAVPCRLLCRLRHTLHEGKTHQKRLPNTSQARPQIQLQPQPQTTPVRPGVRKPREHVLRSSSSTRGALTAAPVNLIEALGVEEVSCQRVQQAIVAIDGGSSKTQPSLFSVLTESCAEGKRAGRHVLVDTLQFVGDGGKFLGVRQLVERWLEHVVRQKPDELKQPLEINEYQKKLLQQGFPFLEQAAEELVNNILKNMVQLIETTMSDLEQREAKSLAVPVIFHSTAGLRDFPRWYREGLFIALRRAINSAPSVKGFVFFTNQEFTRPISGQFEAICAFLTANYLLGNLAKLREHQQAEEQRNAGHFLLKALQQRDDTLRQLGRGALSFDLERKFTEEIGDRRSPRTRISNLTTVGEDGNNKSSVSELACEDVGCSATSPFLHGTSITRCRSGIPDIRFCAHEYLTAIVESGGASMQIAFPVRRLDLLPPDTRIYNLQKSGFLSEDYPPTDVVAVSFMQLGSNSAGGLFLKLLCAPDSPYISEDKLCVNPCFHQNYAQPCSAGEVVISDTGEVTVLGDALHNRLRPAAVFCGEDNAEVFVKTSTEVECRASNFDPLASLQRRLEIPNCERIVGSGNFDKCVEAVTQFLIQPQFPLPANQEAVAAGFENPSQIFSFFSSRAPLLITGNSLVIPVRTLQTTGFLPQGELLFAEADVGRIEQASKDYCGTPLVKDYTGTLRLRRQGKMRKSELYANGTPEASTFTGAGGEVPTLDAITEAAYPIELERSTATSQRGAHEEDAGKERGLKIDSMNYENCQRLATIVALLRSIYKGAERPSHILFATELQVATAGDGGREQHDQPRPEPVGKLGWQIGTILRHMSNEAGWRKLVYELGAAHSLHDRMRRENKRAGA